MKFPIKWHEQTLATYRENYKREQARLELEKRRLLRWEADIIVWEMQIKEAKERGADGFDRDKFLKSQAKRVLAQALPDDIPESDQCR